MTVDLRCPECRTAIELSDVPRCSGGHEFGYRDGVVDFLSGSSAADAELAIDHRGEADGLASRVDNFLYPWLQALPLKNDAKVLDDGCGNAQAVKRLVELGVDAYGVDPGVRVTQWATLGITDRLFIADGTKLPFPDKEFDAVFSSGVIEHLGEGQVSDRREQEPHKQRYVNDLIRVLKPGGRAIMAAPNGAIPVDFWHTSGRAMRLHRPYEAWMPNSFAVRRWVRKSPIPATVRFLPPENYLAFQRVRQHWYGKVFTPLVKGTFSVIDRFPSLAASSISPFLIAEISRADS